MNSNKNLFFSFSLVICSLSISASPTIEIVSETSNDVSKMKKDWATIYLKNGSVIYGILEQNGDIVVIKTKDGNIFAYPKTEIEKLELNTRPNHSNGAYHHFGFGVSSSETEFNGAFNVINGYQIANKVYFGIGIGIEGYYQDTYVPVVLDIQYYPFSDWDSRPFISANAGKLMLQSDENNGWLYGMKLGFAHRLGNKVDICTTVGYRHGVIERESYDFWDPNGPDSYRRYEVNRIEFGLGFMIK